MHNNKLDSRSITLRRQILNIIEHARRGHILSAFSIMEILRVLYDDVLKVRPDKPLMPDRDRFILSKGHGCLALYTILADKGFFPEEELYRFCSPGAMLGGHPEYLKIPGVEASTGSLGHGLSIGIGIALNGKIDGNDYRTYVLTGDGECNEGSVWEAALCAAKHKLDRLVVIVDYNKMQCYGNTCDVMDLEPFAGKWLGFGFAVKEVDGHDVQAIRNALLDVPFENGKPSVIICHTIKGKGIGFLEGNASWHHKAKVSDNELRDLKEGLESSK